LSAQEELDFGGDSVDEGLEIGAEELGTAVAVGEERELQNRL
jgi:hypothetical protein